MLQTELTKALAGTFVARIAQVTWITRPKTSYGAFKRLNRPTPKGWLRMLGKRLPEVMVTLSIAINVWMSFPFKVATSFCVIPTFSIHSSLTLPSLTHTYSRGVGICFRSLRSRILSKTWPSFAMIFGWIANVVNSTIAQGLALPLSVASLNSSL